MVSVDLNVDLYCEAFTSSPLIDRQLYDQLSNVDFFTNPGQTEPARVSDNAPAAIWRPGQCPSRHHGGELLSTSTNPSIIEPRLTYHGQQGGLMQQPDGGVDNEQRDGEEGLAPGV